VYRAGRRIEKPAGGLRSPRLSCPISSQPRSILASWNSRSSSASARRSALSAWRVQRVWAGSRPCRACCRN